MILNSDFLLPHIRTALRRGSYDASRHVLCPECKARTRLYSLSDGRKKCSMCGTKFTLRGQKVGAHIRQWSDTLTCFVLDIPALRAAKITKYRYRLVAEMYASFRMAIVDGALTSGVPINGSNVFFGIKLSNKGEVHLEPMLHRTIDVPASPGNQLSQSSQFQQTEDYPAFICNGHLHRFPKRNHKRMIDGIERFWAWTSERLHLHHGISKRKMGYYLKELEWKYNHRNLSPEDQAIIIAGLLSSRSFKSQSRSTPS